MFTCNAKDIENMTKNVAQRVNPSLGISANGRMFVSYQTENSVFAVYSDDDAMSWSAPCAMASVKAGESVFDSRLWIDPQNRLWLMWSVIPSNRVECVICSDIDKDVLSWTDVRTLDFGLLLARPLVSTDGAWLFTTGVTDKEIAAREGAAGRKKGIYVFETTDAGETFVLRGKPFADRNTFDSITATEKTIFSRPNGVDIVGKTFFVAYVQVSYGVAKFVSPDACRTFRPEADSTFGSYYSQFDAFTIGDHREKKFVIVNNMHFGEGGKMCLCAMTSNNRGDNYQGVLELEGSDAKSFTPDIDVVGNTIYVVYSRENAQGVREIALARFTDEDVRAYSLVDESSYLGRLV